MLNNNELDISNTENIPNRKVLECFIGVTEVTKEAVAMVTQ